MLSNEQFEAMIELAKEKIREEVKEQEKLWKIEDIAGYAQLHKNTIYHLRQRPDFPKPIDLVYEKGGKSRLTQRWEPEVIKSWFKRQRAA